LSQQKYAGFRKIQFLKNPTHWVFGFIGFWTLSGFQIFYLNEQLGSLSADLAYQLSFYLDLPAL